MAVATESYERKKLAEAARNREKSKAGREIGPLPEPVDPERRERCLASLRKFAETYFAEIFACPWSQDHLDLIADLERVIAHGGQKAMAMPRGSGKTSLTIVASMWALFQGRHRFLVFVGATQKDAEDSLKVILGSLEDNDLLADDFPEVCYPITRLEGVHQRRLLLDGEPIKVELCADSITLPDVAGSVCSGSTIKVAGITGRIRGLKQRMPDGSIARPSLVVIDDPQTDESAKSLSQSDTRERILNGAILGLAGPRRKISAIMPCTVISADDMADRILDPARNPVWHGTRTKFLAEMCDQESESWKLWLQYVEIRKRCQRERRPADEATDFYRENRAVMDAGTRASWEHRFNEDEISAIQNAWNFISDRGFPAFQAEYQNTPIALVKASESRVTGDGLIERLNRLPRGVVPVWCSRLTAFIDVQESCLFWMVCAWSDNFAGTIVDYGTWPEQSLNYFTLHQVRKTIAAASPGQSFEAALYSAVNGCVNWLASREWERQETSPLRVERLLIDANWGDSTEVVKAVCRATSHSNVVLPSHGHFFRISTTPLNERSVKPGDRVGTYWRIPVPERGKSRHVLWDANWWKTFASQRLTTAIGGAGAVQIWGTFPEEQRMLFDHLTSEVPVPVESQGRTGDEWTKLPGRDNHYWDCFVGNCVAADMLGCKVLDGPISQRRRVSVPSHMVAGRAR